MTKKYNPSSAGIFDSWNTNLEKQKSAEAHKIFWKFIRDERNSLLKEYKTTAGQGVTAPSKLVEFDETGEWRETIISPVQYHYKMNSGTFFGTDQRDLIRDAITWWEAQLDFLDEKLEEQKKTTP